MQLKESVVSNFKRFVYAKKGTEVILISTTLHVAIVENKETKDRFSCHIENLTLDDIPVAPEVAKQPSTQILKPAAKAKTNKPTPQQNTLF